MKIHEATEATVELTDREQETKDRFDFLQFLGPYSVKESAEQALADHKGTPSKEFVEWLSEGTLTKTGKDITPVEANATA